MGLHPHAPDDAMHSTHTRWAQFHGIRPGLHTAAAEAGDVIGRSRKDPRSRVYGRYMSIYHDTSN